MAKRLPFEGLAGMAAAVCGGIFLPGDFYSKASAEIVTVLGILMAAYIPTMLLAATTLRAGRFTRNRIKELSAALGNEITLLGGLFICAMFGALLIIAGKSLDWSLEIFIPIGVGRRTSSWLFTAPISFCLVFLSCRTMAVVRGAWGVHAVTSRLAEDEATDRDNGQPPPAQLTSPPGYGERVNL